MRLNKWIWDNSIWRVVLEDFRKDLVKMGFKPAMLPYGLLDAK